MGDQEQRIVQHEIGGRNREQHAGHCRRATKVIMKAIAHSIGGSKRHPAAHMVKSQLKISPRRRWR